MILFFICTSVFIVGCGGSAENGDVIIKPGTFSEEKLIATEIIPLNNCGGNSKLGIDVERSRELTYVVTDKNGYELGTEHFLIAALEKEYNIENGTKETQSHTIHLETKANSYVEYTIEWKEIWINGDVVVYSDGMESQTSYKVKKGIVFEIKEVRELSCDTVPLKLLWHLDRKDNVTVATEEGEKTQLNSGYRFVRVEGYVFPTQRPNTTPLKLYWHPNRKDYVTVATKDGESAQLESGYIFVRVEGYIFSKPQPGTVPLKLYWNPNRQDNATVAVGDGEQAQLSSGYKFVRTEGYIFPAN